jgi:hypothetical protein
VIVMLTGDFLSMSLTTDNVRPSKMPNAWRIGRVTLAGVILGVCLLAFCSGVLALGKFGLNLPTEALRTLAFIVLVFGSQASIYAIRERRHLWGSRPSALVSASSVADVAIASTLAIGGIAMTRLPLLAVVGTLVAAAIFAFILDFVKVPVFARLGITESPVNVTDDTAPSKGVPMTESDSGPLKASGAKPDVKTESDASPSTNASPDVTSPEVPEEKRPPAPETHAQDASEVTPQLVSRVHKLYEELGREDVRAVQNWDRAHEKPEADVSK